MKLRVVLLTIPLAFAVTLAIVIGWRLSDAAMAVVLGVLAGVTASIPTSLIVVWLVARSQPAPPREPPPAAEPRIIVVQASPESAPLHPSTTPTAATLPFGDSRGTTEFRAPRRFTIIGGAGDELE